MLKIYDIGKIIGLMFMLIAVCVLVYFTTIDTGIVINIWGCIALFWLGSSVHWQSSYYEIVKENEIRDKMN